MTPAATDTKGRGGRRQQQGDGGGQQRSTSALTVITAKDPRDAISQVDHYIGQRHAQLASMLASNPGAADQMRALVRNALSQPKLAEKLARADLATVVQAVFDCASLGLMPVAATAQAYFVPYWNKDKGLYDIVLIPGYRGLMKLVVDGTRVVHMEAHVVFEKDHFVERYGSARTVEFTPFRSGTGPNPRGERIGALSIAYIPNPKTGTLEAFHQFIDEPGIARVRASSRAADKGPWVDWPDEMRTKTVIRHHSKTLPLTPLAERAFAFETEAEDRHAPPPAAIAGATPTPIPAFAAVREDMGLPSPTEDAKVEGAAAAEGPTGEAQTAIEGEYREAPASTTPAQAAAAPPAAAPKPDLPISHPDAEPPDDWQPGAGPGLFEGQ